jgi:mono/diheme cytochrome c family protein
MRKPILLTLACGLLFVASSSAQDGATLFQSRCAPCHGINGEGKRNQGSPLKGIDVKLGRLTQTVTKGGGPGPHSRPLPNLSVTEANSIAAYLKAPAPSAPSK